ncbi:MAG: hypothetical protein NTZ49_03055 [Candidatus Parcubacteria bacterium]|nr:hypothetical protein [Candidatus Parcubacteria bacterium]
MPAIVELVSTINGATNDANDHENRADSQTMYMTEWLGHLVCH